MRVLGSLFCVSLQTFNIELGSDLKRTALIAVEDTWHAHQVQRHSKLCICLNV